MARVDGVLAGRLCVDEALLQVDPTITVEWRADDGDRIAAGQTLAVIAGPLPRHPHRRAHRAELPRPPVGHRHGHEPLRRRGRGGGRDAPQGLGHPQDHARPAGAREGRRPGRRRAQPPGQPVRLGAAQGQPPHGARHRPRRSAGPAPAGPGDSVARRVRHLRSGRRGARRRRRRRAARQHDARRGPCLRGRGRPPNAGGRSPPCLVEVSGGITLDTIASFAGTGADHVSIGSHHQLRAGARHRPRHRRRALTIRPARRSLSPQT